MPREDDSTYDRDREHGSRRSEHRVRYYDRYGRALLKGRYRSRNVHRSCPLDYPNRPRRSRSPDRVQRSSRSRSHSPRRRHQSRSPHRLHRSYRSPSPHLSHRSRTPRRPYRSSSPDQSYRSHSPRRSHYSRSLHRPHGATAHEANSHNLPGHRPQQSSDISLPQRAFHVDILAHRSICEEELKEMLNEAYDSGMLAARQILLFTKDLSTAKEKQIMSLVCKSKKYKELWALGRYVQAVPMSTSLLSHNVAFIRTPPRPPHTEIIVETESHKFKFRQ